MTRNSSAGEGGVHSLRELLHGIATWPDDDLFVDDITLDSRAVRAGSVFFALPGMRSHGVAFAAQAVTNNAVAILWEPAPSIDSPPSLANTRSLAVPNLSRHIGAIADKFFGTPSAQLTIAGVTGTNGKTTSAFLIPAALGMLRQRAGFAGTLGYGAIDALQSSAHTTADCITVHRQLAAMRSERQTHVGMEVSSHALDQGRIDGVRMHTALFTNLTRDHLDYHGTIAAYGAAKEQLFYREGLQHAVVNVGDPFGRSLAERLLARAVRPKLTTYSVDRCDASGDAYLYATRIERAAHGLVIDIDGSWGPIQLHSRLIGLFNVENLLGVLAVLLGWEIPLVQAAHALEQCYAPPGRMETIALADRPTVVVDYAHSPDALSKALQTAREHCAGRLICVFGCGGERDAGKRPMMAAIAAQYADVVIVTDDNPRMEDPSSIVADILRGLPAPHSAIVERDRGLAITHALQIAKPSDLVLIAGKGHEDYQIIKRERLHFSDREVAQRLLERAT
ncbi:MAG: UDP-N-acetylmuramoyl-L-alanyl-D-glutamate--2,6-diaminopimelate ligase [Candidatus Obscuribacterales bacterium]|nr:UDP-N-acetylmuramoyl-L-alanyl-D-glutamate--2,6-diaminopimelate ligase [Steroidobacteraceae bacterium]